MPIPSSCVNQISTPAEETIDPRWAMNFAAAIDDFNPRLYATDEGPLQVHPLYLGYTEWEATKQVMAPVQRRRAGVYHLVSLRDARR